MIALRSLALTIASPHGKIKPGMPVDLDFLK